MTLAAVKKYVTGVLMEWKPNISLGLQNEELENDITEIISATHTPPEISINITETETNDDILDILSGYDGTNNLKFSQQDIEDDIDEIKE